jgi:hypothetical protein
VFRKSCGRFAEQSQRDDADAGRSMGVQHLDHGHGLPNNDQAIMPPGWGAVRPLALRNGRTRSVPGLAS